jgi:hypothetical protein
VVQVKSVKKTGAFEVEKRAVSNTTLLRDLRGSKPTASQTPSKGKSFFA